MHRANIKMYNKTLLVYCRHFYLNCQLSFLVTQLSIRKYKDWSNTFDFFVRFNWYLLFIIY